eukprot:2745877-Lingulodinium_polyedra.AAC.1
MAFPPNGWTRSGAGAGGASTSSPGRTSRTYSSWLSGHSTRLKSALPAWRAPWRAARTSAKRSCQP